MKKDFGVHLKESGANDNIIITAPIKIINLIMYVNDKTSITVEIDEMLGSFDFDDNVLWKIVKYLKTSGKVTPDNFYMKDDTPTVKTWYFKNDIIVDDFVLTCHLDNEDKSALTDEEFIPIWIDKIKIF